MFKILIYVDHRYLKKKKHRYSIYHLPVGIDDVRNISEIASLARTIGPSRGREPEKPAEDEDLMAPK